MSFLKILVIGDVSTGKTSLVNRIVSNNFSENYKPTIGCEFGFKVIDVNGETIRVQLWDLAGQDRLGGMSRLYCRDAHGALVVCDLTRPDTLEKTIKWKSQVDEFVTLPDKSSIPMVLCVNKSDLAISESLTADQLSAFSTQHKYSESFFTSAKTGQNAEEAIVSLVQKIIKKQQTQPIVIDPRGTGVGGGGLKLARQNNEAAVSKKKGCCA